MLCDAALPLQRQMIIQLESNVELQTEMQGKFKIGDQTDIGVHFPRIVLGDTRAFVWQSATFDGQEHEIQLVLWNVSGGSDKAKSIAAVIIGELHNADFPIAGHALVDMQFEKSETRYMKCIKGYQTILHFKSLTVSD